MPDQGQLAIARLRANPKTTRWIRHGVYSPCLTSLPKGCGWIRTATTAYRRACEAAVIEARGKIGLYEASLIASVVTHEQVRLFAWRYLRTSYDELGHDGRRVWLELAMKATTARDRVLRDLGLHLDGDKSAINGLYDGADPFVTLEGEQ